MKISKTLFQNCFIALFGITSTTSLIGSDVTPVEGILKIAKGDKATELQYICSVSSTGERIEAKIDTSSQMLEIVLSDSGESYRGIATRARYREEGQNFETYFLSSRGSPFFYDFTLLSSLSEGSVSLTIVNNGRAIRCQGSNR